MLATYFNEKSSAGNFSLPMAKGVKENKYFYIASLHGFLNISVQPGNRFILFSYSNYLIF